MSEEKLTLDCWKWNTDLMLAFDCTKFIVEAASNEEFLKKQITDYLKETEQEDSNILLQHPIYKNKGGPSAERLQEFIGAIQALKDEALKRAWSEYKLMAVNLGLVHQCAAFEEFLESSLKAIFYQDRDLFYGIVEGNLKIEKVSEIKDLRTNDQIFEYLLERTLRTFSYKSIGNQLDYFEKFGLHMNDVFGLNSLPADVRQRYGSLGKQHLVDIFEKRHQVAHKCSTPLTDIMELKEIYSFFRAVVLSLVNCLNAKLNIRVFY